MTCSYLCIGGGHVIACLKPRRDAAGCAACELCGKRLNTVKHIRPHGPGFVCKKHPVAKKDSSAAAAVAPGAAAAAGAAAAPAATPAAGAAASAHLASPAVVSAGLSPAPPLPARSRALPRRFTPSPPPPTRRARVARHQVAPPAAAAAPPAAVAAAVTPAAPAAAAAPSACVAPRRTRDLLSSPVRIVPALAAAVCANPSDAALAAHPLASSVAALPPNPYDWQQSFAGFSGLRSGAVHYSVTAETEKLAMMA